jgi:hypothetical protein
MGMKRKLTFYIKGEGDGDGELFIRADAGDFCGVGSAWFNLQLLSQRVEELTRIPIDSRTPPVIAGGYVDRHGSVIQEHVFLSVCVKKRTGELALTVRLSSRFQDETEYRFSFSGEFKSSYEQLCIICVEMKKLIERGCGSFSIEEET